MRYALALALVLTTGCCTTNQYRGMLAQLRENLAEDIGPKYKKYLDADTARPADLKDNDYKVVSDSVAAIDRVLAENPVEEGGGE